MAISTVALAELFDDGAPAWLPFCTHFGVSPEIVTTTLKLPVKLNEALRAIAAADHRPINATIVVVLEQHIATRNHKARVAALGEEIVTKHGELLRRLALDRPGLPQRRRPDDNDVSG